MDVRKSLLLRSGKVSGYKLKQDRGIVLTPNDNSSLIVNKIDNKEIKNLLSKMSGKFNSKVKPLTKEKERMSHAWTFRPPILD